MPATGPAPSPAVSILLLLNQLYCPLALLHCRLSKSWMSTLCASTTPFFTTAPTFASCCSTFCTNRSQFLLPALGALTGLVSPASAQQLHSVIRGYWQPRWPCGHLTLVGLAHPATPAAAACVQVTHPHRGSTPTHPVLPTIHALPSTHCRYGTATCQRTVDAASGGGTSYCCPCQPNVPR